MTPGYYVCQQAWSGQITHNGPFDTLDKAKRGDGDRYLRVVRTGIVKRDVAWLEGQYDGCVRA